MRIFIGLLLAIFCIRCSDPRSRVDVILHTERGDIALHLFDDAPRHKANFLKLAREGYFNGMTFHRILAHFMIQSGDPSTRPNSRTRKNNPGYMLPAEISAKHVHTAGAIGAAREDESRNPQLRSSGSQFYIVTGKRLLPTQIDSLEEAITFSRRDQYAKAFLKTHAVGEDFEAFLRQSGFQPFRYTPAQRRIYQTQGGSPWLDDLYTVFGEVLSGREVVAAIGSIPTVEEVPQQTVRITHVSLPND